MPFFTIITSTLNSETTLPRLIHSLYSQTLHNFNWIVQDGASTDSTLSIVKSCCKSCFDIYYSSEKDSGIYDAWNRAIYNFHSVLGEWILFMGADDVLYDTNVLMNVFLKLQNVSLSIKFASGHIVFTDFYTCKLLNIFKGSSEAFSKRFHDMPIPHQGFFARREFFTPNCFDQKFKIAGDYDFILRNWARKDQLLDLNIFITKMSNSGISSFKKNKDLLEAEILSILKKYSIIYYYRHIIVHKFRSFKLLIRLFLSRIAFGSFFLSYYDKYK